MTILAELLKSFADHTYHPYKKLYGDLGKIYKQDAVRMAFGRAESRGLVEKFINNEEVFVQLTALGKEKLSMKYPVLKVANHNFCVVVFDIPEKNRLVRDLLRLKLREVGFLQGQKSVWIGKNINLKSLRKFLVEAKLADHVFAFETSDLGNSKLENSFKKLS